MAAAEDYFKNIEAVRSGNLEVRLAENNEEIDAAQALRYKVFYDEMSAKPNEQMLAAKRDYDRFDKYWDHLLVIDNSKNKILDQVIGTYRLNRKSEAKNNQGFYSSEEYNIDGLLNYPGEILELGRSCVHQKYRNGQTMQLLWRGIANYVFFYNIKVMFGCASFPEISKELIKKPLSYLHHYHLAPKEIRPIALSHRYINMDLLPKELISIKEARRLIPPLVKGYLRLGAYIGEGAVLDKQFGTTDIFIVLKTDQVTKRYRSHYELDKPDISIL
jgi:L-ornithine Nalpha-acyltransferase